MSGESNTHAINDRSVGTTSLHGSDVAALCVIAAATLLTIGGGLHFSLFGVRVSISSPVRAILCAGMVLLAAGYAVRSRSSRASRVWEAIDLSAWRDHLPLITRVVLTTRLTTLVIGLLAVATIGIGPEARFQAFNNPWLNLPARWDAEWYSEIAAFGYDWDGDAGRQQSVVFFPAFPLLARVVAELGGISTLIAAWLLALAAFACAVSLFIRLVRRDHGDDVATTAAWFLSAYPFAVYFSAPYSESLFLLAMCAIFLSGSEARWGHAAGWGLVAGLTRPNAP